MSLESATYISQLVTTNPVGATDLRSTADDHLRLIKSTLQATFPGMAGRFSRVQLKSAGFTVGVSDNTSLFNCNAAMIVGLTAAATLGNGFLVAIVANGAAVAVDPNGAELINGSTTLSVPDGSMMLLWCDGTGFFAMTTPLNVSGSFVAKNGIGHVAIGNAATFDPLITLYTKSTLTDLGPFLTINYGSNTVLDLNPATPPGTTLQVAVTGEVDTRAGNAQNFFVLLGVGGSTLHSGSGTVANGNGANGYYANAGPGATTTGQGVAGTAEAYDGTAGTLVGVYAIAQAYGDAVATDVVGVQTYGGTADETSVITNAYGVRVLGPTKGASATITNNTGLYIADQSGVGSTIHRNIHSAGATSDNLFEGSVLVDGNVSVIGTTPYPISATRTTNGGYEIYAQNLSGGASAYTQVTAYNSTNKSAGMGVIPDAVSLLGLAGASYLVAGNAWAIYTASASPIVFAPNNVEAGRFTPAGGLLLGSTDPAIFAPIIAAGTVAKATSTPETVGIFRSHDSAVTALELFVRVGNDSVVASRWAGLSAYEEGVGPKHLVLQDLGGKVLVATAVPYSGGGNFQVSGVNAKTGATETVATFKSSDSSFANALQVVMGNNATALGRHAELNIDVGGTGFLSLNVNGGQVVIGSAVRSNGSFTQSLVVVGPSTPALQLTNGSSSGGGAIQVTAAGTAGLSFHTHTGAVGSETYNERLRLDANGNVIVNTNGVATTATDGFLYIPSCAGTPTGVPTTYTSRLPLVIDRTNNKLYFYSSGAWRDAGP